MACQRSKSQVFPMKSQLKSQWIPSKFSIPVAPKSLLEPSTSRNHQPFASMGSFSWSWTAPGSTDVWCRISPCWLERQQNMAMQNFPHQYPVESLCLVSNFLLCRWLNISKFDLSATTINHIFQASPNQDHSRTYHSLFLWVSFIINHYSYDYPQVNPASLPCWSFTWPSGSKFEFTQGSIWYDGNIMGMSWKNNITYIYICIYIYIECIYSLICYIWYLWPWGIPFTSYVYKDDDKPVNLYIMVLNAQTHHNTPISGSLIYIIWYNSTPQAKDKYIKIIWNQIYSEWCSFFDDTAWLRNVKQIGLQRFPGDGTYKSPIVLGSRTHHNQHPTGLKLVDSTFLLSTFYSLLLKMAIDLVDLPINSMVIFHSYVSLPEGISYLHLQQRIHL